MLTGRCPLQKQSRGRGWRVVLSKDVNKHACILVDNSCNSATIPEHSLKSKVKYATVVL